MFHSYVYCIRLVTTGEYYYGSRSANIRRKRHPDEDFRLHYKSSSPVIKRLVAEHGEDSFDWQIISTDPDPLKSYWEEQDLIRQHIKDKLCLNRHYVDRRTTEKAFCVAGIPKSQEHKDKIGAAHKGRPRSEQERINLSNGQKNKATPSKETRAKLSEAGKNRDYSLEPERNAKISAALTGRKRDPETVKKMSESRKGKPAHSNTADNLKSKLTCPHCQKTGSLGNMKRWHFDKCKKPQISPSSNCP